MTEFLCRNTLYVVNHFDPWSQRLFKVATQNGWCACFLVATWALGHDQVGSLITAIPVATSKVCRDHSSFLSSRNLIFDSQQFPINSSSFSGRDLESVSRLNSGPSYFVFVAVAQT